MNYKDIAGFIAMDMCCAWCYACSVWPRLSVLFSLQILYSTKASIMLSIQWGVDIHWQKAAFNFKCSHALCAWFMSDSMC